MLETTAERLRREAVWRDPDKEMTVGQTIGTRLATLRHLWGAECAQQPNVEETAQKMHAVLREMATAVMRAGGRGSELHQLLDDAARAMEGSATTRAAANDTAFNKVKRVLAVDLPRPPQLAGGEESEEKSAKNELAKRLVPSLDRLTHMVAVAETAWRDATATTITRREQQEGAREFLARRIDFNNIHAPGESSRMGMLALEYTRLVRGGIGRAAQRSTTRAAKYAEVFAKHGRHEATAHSAALTAKKRSG